MRSRHWSLHGTYFPNTIVLVWQMKTSASRGRGSNVVWDWIRQLIMFMCEIGRLEEGVAGCRCPWRTSTVLWRFLRPPFLTPWARPKSLFHWLASKTQRVWKGDFRSSCKLFCLTRTSWAVFNFFFGVQFKLSLSVERILKICFVCLLDSLSRSGWSFQRDGQQSACGTLYRGTE